MNETSGTLHTIRWKELCPWLILVRATRVALMVRVLLLATIGVALTQLGWSLLADRYSLPEVEQLDELNDLSIPKRSEPLSPSNMGPLVAGWAWAIQPLTMLGGPRTSSYMASYFCVAGMWTIAVWGLFGGAIARIAALYLTRDELIGPFAALKSSWKSWLSTAGAPSATFVGLLIIALPLVLTGLFMRMELGALLTSLLMIVPLLLGLGFAIAAIGLLLGWPLMWSTVAVERTDAFDAISRSYAYVYQRPLHLLFYLCFATVLGILAQLALFGLLSFAADACYRLIAIGGGEQVIEQIVQIKPTSPTWATEARQFWTSAFLQVAKSFPLSFLFPTAVAAYLLLRREIDSAEIDQVALETES
ncbi:MAG: hypothetical protein RH917_13440 [Lacipirellulaceae bacterium]